MRKCVKCGVYTLNEACPKCSLKTTVAHPPKFSPNDKYVRHRIILKSMSND
ncbi:MAG: RNA-protein complex protein Nop10 [Sulfolobales archaeon]|nr:RNA-protein complex protein Nop10 [Sulfolobales archaeon]MCX8185735.1 RNA-protein complex protein Nop10 [Sulfolobales archaeon]MDW7970057.1 RNA-protein complex protein Nop10 [Sulfolobales archaeon]